MCLCRSQQPLVEPAIVGVHCWKGTATKPVCSGLTLSLSSSRPPCPARLAPYCPENSWENPGPSALCPLLPALVFPASSVCLV